MWGSMKRTARDSLKLMTVPVTAVALRMSSQTKNN